MPLYEYICAKCEVVQEHHHRMGAAIPRCGEDNCDGELERRWSPTSAPKVTRVKGSRIGEPFYSDKEVHALHGERWRETAKDPTRPGGDRHALYFH